MEYIYLSPAEEGFSHRASLEQSGARGSVTGSGWPGFHHTTARTRLRGTRNVEGVSVSAQPDTNSTDSTDPVTGKLSTNTNGKRFVRNVASVAQSVALSAVNRKVGGPPGGARRLFKYSGLIWVHHHSYFEFASKHCFKKNLNDNSKQNLSVKISFIKTRADQERMMLRLLLLR